MSLDHEEVKVQEGQAVIKSYKKVLIGVDFHED
jgi:hypothetical protein